MDLAAVGGHGAPGFGAAPVTRDEHDPLRRRGDAARAEQIQSRTGGLVEHRQVVVGVGGHPDHIADRYHRAAAADAHPGAALQILQRGADDDRGRQPVVLTELTAFEHTATDRHQRVVLALRQTAVIVVDLGLRRSARDTGVFVGRVAHSGCGPLGEDRLINRPRFRGEIPFERGHLVRALRPLRHAAAALAFGVVGFGAVLIQQKQGALGLVLEFLGPQPDRVCGRDRLRSARESGCRPRAGCGPSSRARP